MSSDLKKGIYVSIIAAILVMIFIQPLLNLIWRGIWLISNNYYEHLITDIYRNAALGHRNYIEVKFSLIIFSAFIGILTGLLFGTIYLKIRTRGHEKKEFQPSASSKSRVLFKMAFVSLFVGICIILFARDILLNLGDLQLNTSFEQRLTVLAPQISDREYKEFKAMWATMKSKRDFDKIVAKMELTAKREKVELPPLLKWFIGP